MYNGLLIYSEVVKQRTLRFRGSNFFGNSKDVECLGNSVGLKHVGNSVDSKHVGNSEGVKRFSNSEDAKYWGESAEVIAFWAIHRM